MRVTLQDEWIGWKDSSLSPSPKLDGHQKTIELMKNKGWRLMSDTHVSQMNSKNREFYERMGVDRVAVFNPSSSSSKPGGYMGGNFYLTLALFVGTILGIYLEHRERGATSAKTNPENIGVKS